MSVEMETQGAWVKRLSVTPSGATTEDVRLLADQVIDLTKTVEFLKRAGGRHYGILEAAELVEAAKKKEITARFLVGKKEQAVRATNSKLLENVARLLRHYADDILKQTEQPSEGTHSGGY